MCVCVGGGGGEQVTDNAGLQVNFKQTQTAKLQLKSNNNVTLTF